MGTGHLKIFFGEEQEDKVFVLEEGKSYRIGRAKDAEIRLKDIKVSREHCEVKVEGNKHTIKDLGSRNGTFVNGEKAVGTVQLKDGDQRRLGFSVLQFFMAEKGSHVVESPAEAKKCALCNKDISEADIIAGRAEEVDGKQYCPDCMSKMQDLFEESPRPPDLEAPPKQAAATPRPATARKPAPQREPEMPEPPPPSGDDLDLAGLIDDKGEEDLDLLPNRDDLE
jgi:predicted component of type VI protein secretion system